MLRIMERESQAKRKAEGAVKFMHYVPNFCQLLLHLIASAKYMRIVEGNSAYAREAGKFTGLLIPILHSGVGISLWQFTVTPLFTRINLGVMRTIHGFHREFMSLAGRYLK